jgi:hypothetical protein
MYAVAAVLIAALLTITPLHAQSATKITFPYSPIKFEQSSLDGGQRGQNLSTSMRLMWISFSWEHRL